MSDVKHTDKRTETHGCDNERTETHGDLISRKAAIDALTHKWDGMVTSVFDVLKELPSAEPETHDNARKTHSCVCERTETHACVSPCDACRHYPPSSADGKPCSMCPAEGRSDE